MAESAVPPVTFGVKVTKDIGHVHFDVFAGTTPDHRGRCGSLVMRPDEYEAFMARFAPETVVRDIPCCDRRNYVWEHSRGPSDYFRCHSCGGGMTKPRRVQDHEAGSENTDG